MKILTILFGILLLSSCKLSDDSPSELLIKDSNGEVYISILKNFILRKGEIYFHPTKNDIELSESLLVNELKKTKSQLVEDYHFYNESETPLPLNEYKRQYYPCVSENKEKTIYFLGICKESLHAYPKWTTKQVLVVGGGDCFFRGEINLTSKKVTWLSINAPM